MSEFHVEVVRIGPVQKHQNADTLSISHVRGGYPVIFRTGDFKEGDLAVYCPVDSVIPDLPGTEFLGESRRIKAKRLRGVFSMGLLLPYGLVKPIGWCREGENVAERLGITKYVPPEPASAGGEDERDPGFLPTYTDIEGLRRWPGVLKEGEEVVLTEKIHGANARWLWREDRLWAGSHTRLKREDSRNLFWRAANQYDLYEKLGAHPNIALYGEVYGNVQSLKYGAKRDEIFIAVFDAMDTTTNTYLNYDDFKALAKELDLPTVPELYRGPWTNDLAKFAEGNSTIAAHVREGFVVRPVIERVDFTVPGQRVILKLIGEGYLLS